jgi:hypothetical protein
MKIDAQSKDGKPKVKLLKISAKPEETMATSKLTYFYSGLNKR